MEGRSRLVRKFEKTILVYVREWPSEHKWREQIDPEIGYSDEVFPMPGGYSEWAETTTADFEKKLLKAMSPLIGVPSPEMGLGKATSRQVDGDHYSKLAIQPMEYSIRNNLDALQHSIIKYVTRHKDRGGAKDIKKLIHCAQLILEMQYGEGQKDEVQE